MQQAINFSDRNTHAAFPWFQYEGAGLLKIGHSYSGTGEKTLTAHEHLYLEGDKQRNVYILLEGTIGIYKMLSDGRRQIVGFIYPGDILGLDQAETFTNSAEALSACKVRYIPTAAIDKLMLSEPGFGQTVLRATTLELAETRDLLVSLGRKTAMEKLATFLLRISRRMEANGQDRNTIILPMKRVEIGDYLGLTIETVSRNITKLKRAKIVDLVSNSELRIMDFVALELLSDG